MSSVSNVAGSQQQYFSTSQSQTKVAAGSQLSTSQTSTNSTAPQTGSAASVSTKLPPQPSGSGTAGKTVESASTHNADGTYGPKHTLQAPLSYRLLHDSGKATSGVD